MLLHLYYDKDKIVRFTSTDIIITNKYRKATIDVKSSVNPSEFLGKYVSSSKDVKSDVRLALICNWNDQCGISTYTQFLINNLETKLDELKIFSEIRNEPQINEKFDVEYTWKRGQSMIDTIERVIAWKPTVVMIQHEFGLFPKANYFLPMMERLDAAKIPVITTLHSVYEHKDKSVCSAAMKNVIVHSSNAQECLRETLGHKNQRSWVIPHGCVDFGEVEANWNYFGVPYPIIQFGFGFNYKGVDVALDAIAELKNGDPKFSDIFYCYLCSESNHAKNTHANYYNQIRHKINDLSLEDNATIQRGFFSDEELNQHLRTARLAIFPYITDPNNVVYGASGAIRIAMANNIPVIASASHMFDDMDGILPRPFGSSELAHEIDKIFSNDEYRNNLLQRQRLYIKNNSWEITSQRYYETIKDVLDTRKKDIILIH